jgi:hypothetical protein
LGLLLFDDAENCVKQQEPSPMSASKDDLSHWPIEWLTIVPLGKAAELSSLSVDSLKRNHSDKILHLAPRREGMRVGDALFLPDPET